MAPTPPPPMDDRDEDAVRLARPRAATARLRAKEARSIATQKTATATALTIQERVADELDVLRARCAEHRELADVDIGDDWNVEWRVRSDGGKGKGKYRKSLPQQMGVPQQMMPTQLALMTQPQPQRKDVKPKVMCSHPGCGKEFAWQQDLAKHVRKYHSDEPPRFACTHDGCEKKFYERKLLVAHERTHTDERPFACKYPGCGKAFRARNALAYHHKALHESGVVLRCTEDGCRFTTRKAEALATHKLRHQQRAAAKVWKQQKKGEVQAAVKTAKEELRTKSAELVNTQKQLAQEQKAHAKALKELNALRATHAKMKRKVSSSATELETLRSQKRARGGGGGKDVPGDGRGGKGGSKAGAQGGVGLNGGAERNVPAIMPEIVLLDGPTGKMPMLAMDAPAALAAAAAARDDAERQRDDAEVAAGLRAGAAVVHLVHRVPRGQVRRRARLHAALPGGRVAERGQQADDAAGG